MVLFYGQFLQFTVKSTDMEEKKLLNKVVIFVKGVRWCDYIFIFVFVVLQAVCAYIRSIKLQRLKSQTQIQFFIKVKTLPRLLKRLIQTRPHMSTS